MLWSDITNKRVVEVWEMFYDDFASSNKRFTWSNTAAFSRTAIWSGVITMVVVLIIDSFASYVLSRRKKTKTGLILAEGCALLMTGIAWFLPGAPLRFLYGLIFFSSGMSIHSRVCVQLLDLYDNKTRPPKRQSNKPFRERFFFELANTFFFNIFDRICSFRNGRLPSLHKILRLSSLMWMADTCTYLIREWIPHSNFIHTENQTIAIAVVGGVWALASMDLFYHMLDIQFGLVGVPLPLEMFHKYPLLSDSLNEFWGVRWNPIIGKLLQDSFYKPLRRLGVSRASCVVACFTGSAILHAVPQYISTRDLFHTGMMFTFFFLQGVCLVVELLVKRTFGIKPQNTPAVKPLTPNSSQAHLNATSTAPTVATTSTTTVNSGDHLDKVSARQKAALEYAHCCKSAPFQLSTELLLVTCILSAAYWGLEFHSGMSLSSIEHTQLGNTVAAVAVTSGLGATLCYYNVRRHVHLTIKDATNTEKPGPYLLQSFLGSFVGWVWVVTSIMTLLPLFSLPVLSATEDLYTQSFVIGPLVRSLYRLYQLGSV